MKRLTPWSILVAVCLLMALPAVAQEETEHEKRIKELEKKVEQLVKEADAPKQKLMSGAEAERVMEPVGVAGFYDNGYLVFSSRDGDFKYWLDGRINLDMATYRGAENRLPSGMEIRRGRIGVKATVFQNWLAEVDLDFADNAIEIKDMWAGYAGFNNSIIRLGNHKAPFGLDTLTSSKYITFIERSYLDSWSPDRRLGLSYSHWGKNWQVSGGLFGQAGGEFNDKDSLTGGGAGTSQNVNVVARASWAPLYQNGRTIHLGVARAHMRPDVGKIATSGGDLVDRVAAARIVKLDSRAETHVSRAKFLSTGDMKFVNNYDMTGLELAGVFGSFDFQGEYQMVDVNRRKTIVGNYADHSFDGYYAQVGWFPTGEIRPYSPTEGEFGRVMPKHKFGAIQLALRLSKLDLNDLTAFDPIKGGSAQNITAGATWFINPNHRVMFNITKVDNDEYAKPGKDWAPIPAGNSTSQSVVYGDDFTTIALRYQIAF